MRLAHLNVCSVDSQMPGQIVFVNLKDSGTVPTHVVKLMKHHIGFLHAHSKHSHRCCHDHDDVVYVGVDSCCFFLKFLKKYISQSHDLHLASFLTILKIKYVET